jgi:hypothetical protein
MVLQGAHLSGTGGLNQAAGMGMGDMAFEIYSKERQSKSLAPMLSISSKLGRCTFNRAAAEMLDKEAVLTVLLLWDSETYRMAIRPIPKKDPRSFNIRYARDKKDKRALSAAFSGVMFLKSVGYDMSDTKSYPLQWVPEQAHFEVQFPAERLQVKQQPLVAVEGGKKHEKVAG